MLLLRSPGGVLLVAALLLAGCASSGCRPYAPGPARVNFYYDDASATEAELRAFLDGQGFGDATPSVGAPGVFLNANRTAFNGTLFATASSYADRGRGIVSFSLEARDTNVSDDEGARTLLVPVVDAFVRAAPGGWGSLTQASYSGGTKICVD